MSKDHSIIWLISYLSFFFRDFPYRMRFTVLISSIALTNETLTPSPTWEKNADAFQSTTFALLRKRKCKQRNVIVTQWRNTNSQILALVFSMKRARRSHIPSAFKLALASYRVGEHIKKRVHNESFQWPNCHTLFAG